MRVLGQPQRDYRASLRAKGKGAVYMPLDFPFVFCMAENRVPIFIIFFLVYDTLVMEDKIYPLVVMEDKIYPLIVVEDKI